MSVHGRWYQLARGLRWFGLHRVTRYVLSWIIALVVAWQCTAFSWDNFKDERRSDGNSGHTAIDFGGQWIMGRMLLAGQGRYLYDVNHLRAELSANYPQSHEVPNPDYHDVDGILGSFMGPGNGDAAPVFGSCLLPLAAGDGLSAALLTAMGEHHFWQPPTMAAASREIRGPLYPPVNAFVYTPLALLEPQEAYRAMQLALVAFAFMAAWGIQRISRGHIWLPVAAALIIGYPGFSGAQCLGQNSPITLTILVWGWALVAAQRPGWAGAAWGLLAFKPVWALSFFLVPVLTWRWRMALAMAGVGLLQIGLTLPWVGVETWRDWLRVGNKGAGVYNVDENWIFLSRDLLGIPRRLMIDFDPKAYAERNRIEVALVGWALVAAVLEITCRLAAVRRSEVRDVTGPAAAFLLLGAWLSCYHFMYYDVLLSALPVFLLFTEPRQYLQRRFLAWEPLILWHEPLLMPWETVTAEASARQISKGSVSFVALPAANYGWVRNPFTILVLAALVLHEQVLEPEQWLPVYGYPWTTMAAIVLWLWCAWLWTRQRFADQKRERAYGALPITALDVDR
jgi:arabinofuranan 3-O-arabinosyltransferase